MRTITAQQKQALEDLSAEGLLGGLPVQTAEKDIHVTELLKGLSELEVHHGHFGDLDPRKGQATRHDDGIKLVFAGGTCLSKAHGLIRRMSEDIDIKVVLEPTAVPLKGDAGSRLRLKQLHENIEALLVARIAELLPDSLAAARGIFPQLVQSDRDEFLGQNPEFDADPVAILRRTLVAARANGELQERYAKNLLPLVYETSPPAFDASFAAFEAVATDFISAC